MKSTVRNASQCGATMQCSGSERKESVISVAESPVLATRSERAACGTTSDRSHAPREMRARSCFDSHSPHNVRFRRLSSWST